MALPTEPQLILVCSISLTVSDITRGGLVRYSLTDYSRIHAFPTLCTHLEHVSNTLEHTKSAEVPPVSTGSRAHDDRSRSGQLRTVVSPRIIAFRSDKLHEVEDRLKFR